MAKYMGRDCGFFKPKLLVAGVFCLFVWSTAYSQSICPDGQFTVIDNKCEDCSFCDPRWNNCDVCETKNDQKSVCPIGQFNLIDDKCEDCYPICYHENTGLNGCEICDLEPPTFTTKPQNIEQRFYWPWAKQTSIDWLQPQVTDNSGDFNLNWTATCPVSCTNTSCHSNDLSPGVYEVTYNAMDPSGNTNQHTFTIILLDKTWIFFVAVSVSLVFVGILVPILCNRRRWLEWVKLKLEACWKQGSGGPITLETGYTPTITGITTTFPTQETAGLQQEVMESWV